MARYNKSPNPSCANNLTGLRGNETRTRLTGLTGTPRTTGASVSMPTTSFSASIGGAASGCAPGQTWTGVGWVRSSVGRTIRIDLVKWNNGTFVSATNFTDTALTADVWTKVRIVATLGSGTYNEVNWHADLPTSGTAGTLSISSWRLEQVSDTTLEYGDGDDTADGWSWDGTAGNSTSTQSDTPPPPADVPPGTPDEGGIGSGGGAWTLTPSYELVAVARVPQLAAPPLFYEVDRIAWDGLAWTDELSRPQRIDASCSVDTLPDSIADRLENLKVNPTELWVRRDGRIVAAGPLMGWLRQGDTVTLQATGILGYAAYWFFTGALPLTFTATDQLTIAKGLVDHWQNQEYGHFGIDTSGVGTSGVTRDATYERDEINPIGKRLQELGARINGFDLEVDPASRRLRLWYPRQGVNRSVGADAVILDGSNITSPNITASVAPGDLASEAFGVGTGSGTDETLWSQAENVQVRAMFGRVGVAETFDGVSEQSTLDAHTQELLDARGDALIIPGPNIQSTPDADLAGYRVGDTVEYRFTGRLGASGAFRVRKRTVSLDRTGVEDITLEFA